MTDVRSTDDEDTQARLNQYRALSAFANSDDVQWLLDVIDALRERVAALEAENERISGAWADVIQREQRADNEHRHDLAAAEARVAVLEGEREAIRKIEPDDPAIRRANDISFMHRVDQNVGHIYVAAMFDEARRIAAALAGADPTPDSTDEPLRRRVQAVAVRLRNRGSEVDQIRQERADLADVLDAALDSDAALLAVAGLAPLTLPRRPVAGEGSDQDEPAGGER